MKRNTTGQRGGRRGDGSEVAGSRDDSGETSLILIYLSLSNRIGFVNMITSVGGTGRSATRGKSGTQWGGGGFTSVFEMYAFEWNCCTEERIKTRFEA